MLEYGTSTTSVLKKLSLIIEYLHVITQNDFIA